MGLFTCRGWGRRLSYSDGFIYLSREVGVVGYRTVMGLFVYLSRLGSSAIGYRTVMGLFVYLSQDVFPLFLVVHCP